MDKIDNKLKEILIDLVEQIKNIKVSTAYGPSGPNINSDKLDKIRKKIEDS